MHGFSYWFKCNESWRAKVMLCGLFIMLDKVKVLEQYFNVILFIIACTKIKNTGTTNTH